MKTVDRERERKGAPGKIAMGIFLAALLWPQMAFAMPKTAENSWQKGAGVAQWLDQQEVLEAPEDAAAGGGAPAGGEEREAQEGGVASEENSEETSQETWASEGAGGLVMADVRSVLNVREEPDEEGKLAGYLYADCGGRILERRDGWTKLTSGELTGWAKDDYLLFGEEAQEAAKDAGRTIACTTTGALRIRKEPSMEAGVYDLLEKGARYEVVDAQQLAFSDGISVSDDWIAVDYGGKTGYVSAEYVTVEFQVDYGETVEQVEARKEAERQEEQARQQALAEAQEKARQEAQQKEIQKAQAMAADETTLLAALIQCEAGEEPYEGQVAVGAVVVNRVKSSAYPSTVRDVIFASGQFTPAGSGQLGRLLASGSIKSSCLNAAAEALAGATPIGSATHFRRAGSREGIVIGHHVFW